MQYRIIKGTGLTVPMLCLGTMMFGGQTSEEDSLKIMDYAFDQGMYFWDTADMYLKGVGETVVGKGLKGRRDRIILASKVGYQIGEGPNGQGLSRRHILNAIDGSLKRLGTDYLDIYYLHHPDYDTDIEETMYTMDMLVRAGKIRYIGVSNFAAWQIADILALCEKRGYAKPVVTQNVYNALTRGIEGELVPFLNAHDMSMLIYNPIAAGLLAGKHRPGAPTDGTRFANSKEYYDRYWNDENFRAVEKLGEIADGLGMSLIELAFKWCASQPHVTGILTGVSKLSHLEQNIRVFDGGLLDAETLAACDEVWRSLAGTRFAYNR
ncbi:MAG: aldo/keto reductase [Lachnospiraceae bacterium]|nr:aldo/keto reductase [Lachnospiraceae bacterium]